MSPNYNRIIMVVKLIPQGKIASYGQIADLAGLPKRARLVSKALKSTIEPDVPWHRVLNSQGKISIPVTEPGHRLQISLLRSDGVVVSGSKVDLSKYSWQPSLHTLLHELSF